MLFNNKNYRIIICIFLIIFTLLLLIKNEEEHFQNLNNNSKINKKCVIVGCAYNIEKNLPLSIKKVEMMASCFNNCKIIIFENDSTDKTLQILNQWSHNNKNVIIISESKKKVKELQESRTHRLEYARNKLLNEARKLNPYYFINADLDNVLSLLQKKYFLKVFNLKEKWSMIGCNNEGYYRDFWALRCKGWMDGDYWFDEDILKNKKFNNDYKRIINPKDSLFPVQSCFNGLGIYKMKYLDGCKYDGKLEDGQKNHWNVNETCEHVSLNLSMMNKNGGQSYIAPFLITFKNNGK